MHAKHRSPSYGYSSSPPYEETPSPPYGVSPSIHGQHPSEYKGSVLGGFGLGRAEPKPPYLVDSKAKMMMEAGRLAAEYLISQGILPPNSLVHRGQNGIIDPRLVKEGPKIRKEFDNENDNPNCGRYGGATMEVSGSRGIGRNEEGKQRDLRISEVVVGGKRKVLEDSLDGSPKYSNFKAMRPNWNQDSGSGLLGAEFKNIKLNEDELARHQGEKMVATDFGGVLKATDSISCKSGVETDSDSDLENFLFPDTTDSKPFCSTIKTELLGYPYRKKVDKSRPQDSATIDKDDRPSDSGELRDSFYWSQKEFQEPLQQQSVKIEAASKDSQGSSPTDTSRGHVSDEEDLRSKLNARSMRGISPNSIDLVQLSSHGQVPTKARSITRHKIPEAEHGFDQRLFPMHVGRNIGEFLSGRGSNNYRKNDLVEDSGKSCWTSRSRPNRCAEEARELDPSLAAEKDKFSRSYSFSDRSSFMHQQDSGRWPAGFGGTHAEDQFCQDGRMSAYERTRSMFQQREIDNPMFRGNRWEGAKRPREWPPGRISQADEYLRLHNLKAKQASAKLKGVASVSEEVVEPVKEEELVDEKLPLKKDLNVTTKSKAVFSESGSNDDPGSLSTGTKIVDEKLNLNCATTEAIEDPDPFISEKQKASLQISSLLANIRKGKSNESSTPVQEGGIKTECTHKDEIKVLVVDSQPNTVEAEEETVYAFFQELLKDCSHLRQLYQSHDSAKEFDCLVCLSSSSVARKFSNLVGLLKHAKDVKELPFMHKGYGRAICDLLNLNKSNGMPKDVESAEQQSNQSLQNEEDDGDVAEPKTLSLEGVENNMAVD